VAMQATHGTSGSSPSSTTHAAAQRSGRKRRGPGTYQRAAASGETPAEWRRPGAVQGRLGDAPFLPQQLFPACPPPRTSTVGQRRRRSPATWAAQRRVLGRGEEGERRAREGEGETGPGRLCFSPPPRGDHPWWRPCRRAATRGALWRFLRGLWEVGEVVGCGEESEQGRGLL
jgi:hypothetical protein